MMFWSLCGSGTLYIDALEWIFKGRCHLATSFKTEDVANVRRELREPHEDRVRSERHCAFNT